MLFDYNRTNSTLGGRFEFDQKMDQIWSIPQMENTNYFFYKFYTGQDKRDEAVLNYNKLQS
mgnify:CR=1 FL=1